MADTKVSILRGANVTGSHPPVKDGQILFDTADKSIWLDLDSSTRIKLYNNIADVVTDITNIKATLAGIDDTVVASIAEAITELKKEIVLSVEAGAGVKVDATDITKPKVGIKLSEKEGNILSIETAEGEEGLYASVTDVTVPEYSIEKADSPEEGFAATYKLTKDGAQVGASINIIKDQFLDSVALVDENAEGDSGKYIKFSFSDASKSTIYLDIKDLGVDIYTSGSETTDMVVIAIDSDNKITATITDGTITKAKLATEVTDILDAAVQKSDLELEAAENKYVAGFTIDEDTNEIKLIEKDLPEAADALVWETWATIPEGPPEDNN